MANIYNKKNVEKQDYYYIINNQKYNFYNIKYIILFDIFLSNFLFIYVSKKLLLKIIYKKQ